MPSLEPPDKAAVRAFGVGGSMSFIVSVWTIIFFLCGLWFTSDLSSDPQRGMVAVLLLGLGVFTSWRARKSLAPFLTTVTLTMASLFVLIATSDQADHIYARELFGKMAAFALTGVFAAICMLYVLPKLDQRRQAPAALTLSCLSSFAMVIAALAWWLTAVEMNVYPENSVVRTNSELAAEYEKGKHSLGSRGLFLVGRIPGEQQSKNDYVAYYSLADDPELLPVLLNVNLESGETVPVRGPTNAWQTFAWSEGGPRQWMYCLRPGDPVVVWGQPAKTRAAGSGRESYSLDPVRLVARGSMEDFYENFLLPGRQTSKLFGWIGLGCAFVSLFVLIPGLAAFFSLRKHGR